METLDGFEKDVLFGCVRAYQANKNPDDEGRARCAKFGLNFFDFVVKLGRMGLATVDVRKRADGKIHHASIERLNATAAEPYLR